MASFEGTRKRVVSSSDSYHKYPLCRLDPAIQKFIKILRIDLDRLNKHKLNIIKYQRLSEMKNLRAEHVNATRTVQQLKANIRELERTRNQVEDHEQSKFDAKVKVIKQEAIHNVTEFLNIYGSLDDEPLSQFPKIPADASHNIGNNSAIMSASDIIPDTLGEDQLQTHALLDSVYQARETEASIDDLRHNLEDLNSIIHDFAVVVHQQQETIDCIEDNVEHAYEDVHQGTKQLAKASKLKAAILPLAGAVVGTIVAGPVGLIAGAKIGGVLGAVGGCVLGFTSGKLIKKHRDKVTNIEMQKMESKLSESVTIIDP